MADDPPTFQLLSDVEHRLGQPNDDDDDADGNATAFLVGVNSLAAAAASTAGNASWLNDDEYGGEPTADCCELGYERIIVPVIFCIVVVSGCIGNLLVLVVVVRNREQFTSTTNLFIVNLAVADLFFLVFCVPFHAVIYTAVGWPFGDAVCKLVHFVQFASMTASVYTLVAMSIDRFLAVGYPLRTKHLRTPPCALFVAVAVWTVSALLAAPWSVVYTAIEYPSMSEDGTVGTTAYCADDWSWVGRDNRPTAYLVLFVVAYAIPLSCIGVLSALTVRQLWATETTNDGPSRRRSVIAKRRVTRLIAVVVGVFAVCWLPSHVVWLWANYFPLTWHHAYSFFYAKISAHALSYANSSMNPIIYAFLSSRFRREFRRAVRCRRTVGGRGGGGGGAGTAAGSRVIGGASSGTGAVGRSSIPIGGRRGLAAIGDETLGANGQRLSRCYNFQMSADGAAPTATTANSATTMMLMLTAATARHAAGPGAAAVSSGTRGRAGNGMAAAIGKRQCRHQDDEDDEGVVL